MSHTAHASGPFGAVRERGATRRLNVEATMSIQVHVPTPAPTRESAVLREILFPSDLSPESARAFEYARLLAERFQARLVLLHVIPPGPVGPGIRVPEARRRAARVAREQLERWASGLRCRQCVIVEPADSVP